MNRQRRNLHLGVSDSWLWMASSDGQYSVSSTYLLLHGIEIMDDVFKHLWKILAPLNALAFSWRMLYDRIQTCTNLRRRPVIWEVEEVICPICRWGINFTPSLLLLFCLEYLDGMLQVVRVINWYFVGWKVPLSTTCFPLLVHQTEAGDLHSIGVCTV